MLLAALLDAGASPDDGVRCSRPRCSAAASGARPTEVRRQGLRALALSVPVTCPAERRRPRELLDAVERAALDDGVRVRATAGPRADVRRGVEGPRAGRSTSSSSRSSARRTRCSTSWAWPRRWSPSASNASTSRRSRCRRPRTRIARVARAGDARAALGVRAPSLGRRCRAPRDRDADRGRDRLGARPSRRPRSPSSCSNAWGSARARATRRRSRTSSGCCSARPRRHRTALAGCSVLEANVDDLVPELVPDAIDALLAGRRARCVDRADRHEARAARRRDLGPVRARRAGRRAADVLRGDDDARRPRARGRAARARLAGSSRSTSSKGGPRIRVKLGVLDGRAVQREARARRRGRGRAQARPSGALGACAGLRAGVPPARGGRAMSAVVERAPAAVIRDLEDRIGGYGDQAWWRSPAGSTRRWCSRSPRGRSARRGSRP